MASVATLAVKITGDVSDVQSKLQAIAGTLDQVSDRLKSSGTMMSAAVTAPILGVGGAAIKAAADYEQLQVAFSTMLGSGERANQLLADLAQFAAETPFESRELQQSAKMLLAYGTSAEDVTDTLRGLGDIAAGVGVRIEDLSYLYGTTMVQGRMYTADLNQFTSRGIPLIGALAKTMGVAESAVKGMVEEGAVGFPELQAALKSLTDEGGQFSGLMEAQSQTLSGLFSTLTDNIQLSMVDVGNAIVQAFDLKGVSTEALKYVEALRNGIADLAQNNPELLRTGVIIAAVAAAIGPALIGLGFAVGAIKQALTGIGAVAGIVTGLSTPVLLLIGAVAALGAAWYFNWFGMREIVASAWEKLQPALEGIGVALQGLFDIIVLQNEPLGDWSLWWEKMADLLGEGFADTVHGIGESIVGLGNAVQDALDPFVNLAAAIADAGVNSSEAWEAISLLPEPIQGFAYAAQDAYAAAETLFTNVAAVAAAMLTAGVTSTAANEAIKLLPQPLQDVAAALQAVYTEATTGFPTLTKAVSDGQAAITSFGEQAGALIAQVRDFLQPTIDRVVGAFTGLPQTMAPVIPALQGLGDAIVELWTAAQPALTALGMLIGAVLGVGGIIGVNLFASAINALGPIVAAVIEQVSASLRLISGVLTEVTNLIKAIAAGDWAAAWEAVKGIVTEFTDYATETLNNLVTVGQTVADGLLEAIKGALDTLNVDGSAVMTTIQGWWDSAWAAMEKAFAPVEEGINRVKAAVESVQTAIGNFKDWVTSLSIPNPLAGIQPPGWVSDAINAVTGQGQLGITYSHGGLTRINEDGRGELVVLPRGAKVIPHKQSQEMLQGMGGGVTVVIQNANMGSEQDSWRLAYQVDDIQRRRRRGR